MKMCQTCEDTLFLRVYVSPEETTADLIDCPDCTEEVQVCPYCQADVCHLGEDGIDYCSAGCGCIEGEKSVYITRRKWAEAILGPFPQI